jgi:hypothetical protein
VARASLHAKELRIGDAATIAGTRLAIEGSPPDLADLRPPRTASVEIQNGNIHDVKAAAALAQLPPSVRVEEGTGAFGLHLAGPLDKLRGSAWLGLSSLALEAEGVHVRADLQIDARIRAFDPRRGADLGGTRIDVEDARVINPGGEEDTAPGWWAHLQLPRAAIRTRARVADADLDGRCRDARPLVGLFVRREQLPEILSGLFAMDDLAVRGSALAGPGFVALRDLTATGDGASVRVAYRADGSGKRGAALLTVRGITVGVALEDGGTHMHLGAASDWFAEAQARLQPDRAVRPLARAPPAHKRRSAAPVEAAE